MAFLRNPKKNNFTIIDNFAIKDDRLSLKALGLLVKLLSFPDNWEFSENGLIELFKKDGQSSIRSGLKELEDCKYLFRERKRDEKGRIVSVEWIILDNPQLENHNLEKQGLDCVPQLNTKEEKTKKLKTYNTPYNPPEGETEQQNESKPRDRSESEYCKMVASLYNSICKNLVKVQKVTEKRKRAIKKAKKDIEEFGGWEKYFEKINESDYLNGKVTNWKADFDWLLKSEKMVKIMEGSYQNNGVKRNTNIPNESDYDEGIFFEGVK